MIAQDKMDIFPGWKIQVYVANLSAKPILIAKNMIFIYVSKALDYIACPWGKEQSPKRKKEKDSRSKNPCITTKTVQQ